MFEQIILGLVQGIAEWLPISSEGAIVAVKNTFFPNGETLSELIKLALFLHLGTFLAALIYFRKAVWTLTKTVSQLKVDDDNRKVLFFLVISTIVSGVIGFALLKTVGQFEDTLKVGSKFVNLLIALMLLVTTYLQFQTKRDGLKLDKDLGVKDGLLLGLTQGLAVIPGLSRSGLTVSTLLLRRFDDSTSLRLSFLMSLPIVLLGNIFLNFNLFLGGLTLGHMAALVSAFVSGILTIDLLLRLAKKVNFGYFTLFFAILMIASIFF